MKVKLKDFVLESIKRSRGNWVSFPSKNGGSIAYNGDFYGIFEVDDTPYRIDKYLITKPGKIAGATVINDHMDIIKDLKMKKEFDKIFDI